ncbi:MAG: sulfatase [Candidatus Binatia bacterium]|nr:sulfatase [Candidatus Binatia bacterium]
MGLAATLGRVPKFGAALAVGGILAWNLREVTRWPEHPPEAVAATVVIGAAFAAWFGWIATRIRGGPSAAALAAGLGCVAGILALSYPGSETFRHHLLRHHTLIGTPIYYVFETPLEDVYRTARSPAATTRAPSDGTPAEKRHAVAGGDLVFVLVDTLRADQLDRGMPRTAAWAESGFRFDDVVANTSWTRPSVASMFTGLAPEEHGATGQADGLPENRPTLAERLQRRGYETAAFVSNYGAISREAGFARGFDTFVEVQAGDDHATPRAEVVNAAVENWLGKRRARAGSRPLFLYVHYLDPHEPYFGFEPSQQFAELRAAYDTGVEYFDEQFERFRETIERDVGHDTTFLFTADHGEALGEHGIHGHGNALYPEQIDIPLVLHGPGLAAGRSNARLEGRDVFGLALRLADPGDQPIGDWAESEDRPTRFMSVYTRLPGAAHRPFFQITASRRLDDGDDVLIWSGYGNTYELFDRAADPEFRHNLADERPDAIARLRPELERRGLVRAEGSAVRNSNQTREQLRALGYIE